MVGTAAERWAELQGGRGLPAEILAQAPTDPWVHNPGDFAAPAVPADTPSRAAALELLGEGGTVIDVGCGGGRATFAVAERVRHATGVDQQQDMLDRYAADAAARRIPFSTVRGRWPEIAPQVGTADVVLCHHVLHNVVDLPPFVTALSAAARCGVVVEMLTEHPMAWLDPLWERFHGLHRPPPATDADAAAVLRELGIEPTITRWEREDAPPRDPRWVTTRLCLPPEREPEVAEAMADLRSPPRWSATLTWRV